MALKLGCDGCACDIPVDTKPTGRLECCFYCPDCAKAWDAITDQIEAARVASIETFERERAAVLTTARATLTRLPDE